MRAGQALGLGAWLLIIAWLVLYLSSSKTAAGWCLAVAGVLVLAAAPFFTRQADRQVRITGFVMVPCGLFFLVFGLVQAL